MRAGAPSAWPKGGRAWSPWALHLSPGGPDTPIRREPYGHDCFHVVSLVCVQAVTWLVCQSLTQTHH